MNNIFQQFIFWAFTTNPSNTFPANNHQIKISSNNLFLLISRTTLSPSIFFPYLTNNNNLFKSSSSRITQQIRTQAITTQSEPDLYKTKPVLDLEEEEEEERKGKTVIYFSRSRTNRWVFEKSKAIFITSAKKDVGKCLQFSKKRKLNFPARWRRPVGPATTAPAF